MARVQGLGWVAAALGIVLGACPDESRKRPNGSLCEDDRECASGLCVERLCLDPAEDTDQDGLINGLEAELGTSPFDADTDGDGKDDVAELTQDLKHLDSDNDGRPNALESAVVDRDGDCLVDEIDPAELVPDSAVVAATCKSQGVCATATAQLKVLCTTGTATCDYTEVSRYEAVETECDALDNDCNGATDERCGAAPLDCAAVLEADAGAADGNYAIDPDGAAGALAATQVACLMSAERGGWTRWTSVVANARRPGLREYLLHKGGAWYRTPPTEASWDWSAYAPLSGRWVVHRASPGSGENAITDLDWLADCADRGEAGLFGFGCGDGASGLRIMPGGASDAASGTGSVCENAANIFGGVESCEPAIEVYARWVTCASDSGSELGDGGFAALGGSPGALPSACWETKGAVFGPSTDIRSGGTAPSLLANDPTAPGDPFAHALVQKRLMLILGHAYRLSLWLKAENARVVPLSIEAFGGAAFVGQGVDATAAWRRVDIDFLARRTTYQGLLELDFGGDAIGDVWVDDVALTDLGPGACDRVGGVVVGDPTFARGLTCWIAQNDDPMHATIQAVAVTPTEQAMRVTAAAGAAADAVAYVEQLDVPLAVDRWYELTVEADANPARAIEIAIMKDDFSVEYARFSFDFGAARHVQTRRFVVPAGPTPRAVKLRVGVPLVPAGEVTLYQVKLEDMGPNPCVAPSASELLADGDFHYGTLCWEAFQSDPATTFVSASNVAPDGQPPTMLVTMAHAATDANLRQRGLTILDDRWYDVHLWLRSDTGDPVEVTVHEPDGAQIFFSESVMPKVGWGEGGGRFVTTVGSPGGGALDLAVGRPGVGNFVEIDLVTLTDLGPSPCKIAAPNHLVRDPGFAGGLTCWKVATGPGVGVREETVDVSSPPLAIATVIQTAGSPSDLVLFQRGLALEVGVRHTVSFRARSLGVPRSVTIVVAEDNGTVDYLRDGASVPGSWTDFSFDFTPEASTATAVVALELAGYSVDVIIDDVDIVAHP